MKFVQQRHTTGCALACFAMLRNCSYNYARKLLNFRPRYGTPTSKLRLVLLVSFKLTNRNPKTEISSIKNNALILLNTKGSMPDGNRLLHAVVWNAETKEIHDPLKKHPTKRLTRYQKQVYRIWELKPRRK